MYSTVLVPTTKRGSGLCIGPDVPTRDFPSAPALQAAGFTDPFRRYLFIAGGFVCTLLTAREIWGR